MFFMQNKMLPDGVRHVEKDMRFNLPRMFLIAHSAFCKAVFPKLLPIPGTRGIKWISIGNSCD